MTDEPILCSACFDAVEAQRILAMIPQQTCERCGKKCLGYQTADLDGPRFNEFGIADRPTAE